MEYLKYCQTYIRGCGLASNSSPFRKILAIYFFLPPCFLIIAFSVYELWDANNNDIFLVIEVLECISSYTQLTIRKYMIFTQNELMVEIINDCDQLWSFDTCGPELGKKFKQRMKNCWIMVKALVTCGFTTFILMCISARADRDNLLPFLCWIPDFPYATEVLFLSQFMLLMELLYYVMATDGFYLLVCMDIHIQFEMMQEMLKTIQFDVISEKESWEKLTELAKHHNRMLHQKLNQVFSKYYVVQYFMTVAAMTVQTYTLKYRMVNIQTALKSIMYTFSLMFQSAYYLFPASNIEIEAENFSTEIYFLNWQDHEDVKIRKHILFMLMKSQENLELMGEGMVHINRNEYLLMFRLAFTIATLLDGLNQL
ncbi:odorant receptor 131 [Tribolium castaneum]|uniref:Odorant receptor n=1 Tax=Tribolium castaneum TaxID=7070 RepID=D1ZZK7_TRICA|nr:odorant receptor 131 [Tribolium castaneum]